MDGIPPWAVKGAKVVCVNDSVDDYSCAWGEREKIVVGEVYTISRVFACQLVRDVIVELAETDRSAASYDYGFTVGYAIWRFKPVISQSDDVAKFTHLLTPTPPEKADALLSDLNMQWEEDEEVQAVRLAIDAARGRCF